MSAKETITEQIEAARKSSDAKPEWMKKAAYFATPGFDVSVRCHVCSARPGELHSAICSVSPGRFTP